jgi:hypothetical protein
MCSVYEGTRSLPFHTVMEWFSLGSKSFFIWIESFLNRSFWNGQDRIPSKWDYFLWRSLEKHVRMDSLNWWTHSRRSKTILRKKEYILRRSLNCWTLPSGFNDNFDSKLTASEHDTLKLVLKMAEPSMSCTRVVPIKRTKNGISKTVWATNNLSTLLDRAHRVTLGPVFRRLMYELYLHLFEDFCRKCEYRW